MIEKKRENTLLFYVSNAVYICVLSISFSSILRDAGINVSIESGFNALLIKVRGKSIQAINKKGRKRGHCSLDTCYAPWQLGADIQGRQWGKSPVKRFPKWQFLTVSLERV